MFIEELEFIAQNKTCGRGISNNGHFLIIEERSSFSGTGFPLDLVHSYCGISYGYYCRGGWYNQQEYSDKYQRTLFCQEKNSTR